MPPMRTPPERPADQQFNNADSYGMAFETAWGRLSSSRAGHDLSREVRLESVLSELSDHPFAVRQPELVRQVAEFRLRLLRC